MKRFKNVKIVSILGMFANLFLFIIKISVGLFTKSQSMIADSFNSISDVFTSLMTFIGNNIASLKHDDNHNFGHEKAEYIFSMFISISIVFVSLKLSYDAIKALIAGNKVIFSWSLVIVSTITIIIKLSLYFYSRYLNKKENNILLELASIDHKNDVYLTLGVLISALFSRYGIYFVDFIVGILISVYFLINGIKIFKKSFDVLMDVSIDLETREKILKLIINQDGIVKIDSIHSISVGYKFIIVLNVSVDGNINTFKSHEIADNIEQKIKNKFKNIRDVFVHINPI